ncbi:unnamed protein product [Pylaiella littoralis]
MEPSRHRLSALLFLGCWLTQGAGQNSSSSSAVSLTSSDGSSSTTGLAPVIAMDSGSFHTVVIIRDSMVNVVKDWGANGKGQLGLNDTKDRGDNDGEVGNLLPEVELGTDLEAVYVTAGLRHTAAIMGDGTIRSWGYNRKGQLGVGTILDVGDEDDEMGDNMAVTDLGDVTPVAVRAGGWHTCCIIEGDHLKCWGYNQWGELGLGDHDDRGDEPDEMGDNLDFVDLGDDARVVSLALGDWHTCALLDGGSVKCWGKNFSGQLGLGDDEHRGDNSGEMGDDLDEVDLGGKQASAIAAGEEHTCAILEDGSLVCWGLGTSGQLGQGNADSIGDSSNDMSNLAAIDLGSGRTAVEVAAGGNHTCAILDNADVKCWGNNDFGELGQGDTLSRGSGPGEMGDNLLPISLPTGWTLSSLSLGYYHTCALVSEVDVVDNVVCWGANFDGQTGLGQSETENVGDEPGEMGDNLSVANLGGDYMDESGDEFYEQTWFLIAVGVGGGALLCCLCLLVCRAHGDNSGRDAKKTTSKAKVPAAHDMDKDKQTPVPGNQETPRDFADSASSNPNSAGTAAATGVGAASAPTRVLRRRAFCWIQKAHGARSRCRRPAQKVEEEQTTSPRGRGRPGVAQVRVGSCARPSLFSVVMGIVLLERIGEARVYAVSRRGRAGRWG